MAVQGAGFLGSGGKVTLTVERPLRAGKVEQYVVTRVLGEPAQVRTTEASRPIDIEPSRLFGPTRAPLIFGQREIQAVAADERYRLHLLDDLIGEDARLASRKVGQVRNQLKGNEAQILEATRRMAERDDHEQQLQRVRHEIDVYEREGIADKLRAHTNLRAEAATLTDVRYHLEAQGGAWIETSEAVLAEIRALRQTLGGHADQSGLLGRAVELMTALHHRMEGIIETSREIIAETGRRIGKPGA
ncbi:MAG: hypothetical protein ACRD0K_28510 [Egibacteraceae bacterium]